MQALVKDDLYFFCVADVWPGKRTRRLRCERQNHGEDVLQEKPQAQQRLNDKSLETRLFVERARLAHVVLNALKTTGEVVRGVVSCRGHFGTPGGRRGHIGTLRKLGTSVMEALVKEDL